MLVFSRNKSTKYKGAMNIHRPAIQNIYRINACEKA